MDIQALISAAISGHKLHSADLSAQAGKQGPTFADIVQALQALPAEADPSRLAGIGPVAWELPIEPGAWDASPATSAPAAAELTAAEDPLPSPLAALLLPASRTAVAAPGAGPAKGVQDRFAASAVAADVAAARQTLPDAMRSADRLPLSGLDEATELSLPPGFKSPVAPGAVVADQTLASSVLQSTPQHKSLEAMGRAAAVSHASVPGISTPVGAREWSADFAQRVVWMVGQRAQFAEIAVNPPNLGGVEVRLSMNEQSAGAQFFSPHASVRDALEAALPRLREMLADAGITLGQAEVRDQAFSGGREWTSARDEQADADVLTHAMAMPLIGARGLIDLYA